MQTLRLRNVLAAFQPVASICSALRHANSLKELDIKCGMLAVTHNPHPDNSKLMWVWIAYGIFHPDSEARLNRLSFTGPPLKHEDIAMFETVISSSHPARQLWVLKHGYLSQGKGLEEVSLLEDQRLFVQLKANTKFKTLPRVRSQALETVAVDSEELEVALQLETWVCVVISGCGLGWVSSASIVSRRDVPSKCSASSDHVRVQFSNEPPLAGANVRALSRHWSRAGFNQVINRNVSQEPLESFEPLLRMIGHSLEELNYTSMRHKLIETDLAEILDACPNLWHLNLMSNEFESIKPLTDRYETNKW